MGRYKEKAKYDNWCISYLKKLTRFIRNGHDIVYTKARHLSGEQVQDIEAEMTNHDGRLHWTWEQGNILYMKAIEMLKNKLSVRDIAEELGVGKSTIQRWKNKAQSDGLL